MKQFYLLFLGLFIFQANAQSSYTSTNYAALGDSFYITSATNLTLDFETTAANYTWDFSALTGVSQDQLQFRNPNTTGYVWAYIYNTNNTNLSSTKNETKTINGNGSSLAQTSINSYLKKSTSELKQVASSFKIDYNGTQIPVTNQFADADIMYKFPINFGNSDTDNSGYTIDIPNVYYQDKTLQRTNEVDGWGSVTTPYGTFSNTLRMKTTLVENDTISVVGKGVPRVIRTTREFKWFETSKKYPVLIVTQSSISDIWVTTKVEYLDNQQDFKTLAGFAYTPIDPIPGATVYFQNLSTNATTYTWDFGDSESGDLNMSTEQNPTHVFNTGGNFQVKLISSNGTYTDEVIIPVLVGVLGVGEVSSNDGEAVLVYPNPFSSNINTNQNLSTVTFSLSSSNGQIIYQGNEINKQDFSSLSPGIYILTIESKTVVKTYKLIKG